MFSLASTSGQSAGSGPAPAKPNGVLTNGGQNGAKLDALNGVQPYYEEIKQLAHHAKLLENFVWTSRNMHLDEFETVFNGNLLKLLAEPLKHNPRNGNDKTLIEQQNRQVVDVVNVLRLAEELDLNEKEALNVWTTSLHHRKTVEKIIGKVLDDDPYIRALMLFFWKREAMLLIISRLVRLRNPLEKGTISEEKVLLVRAITDRLLIDYKMPRMLMETIHSHNERITSLLLPQHRAFSGLSTQLKALRGERTLLAECLFVIFSGTFADPAESIQLVKLISEISSQWLEQHVSTTPREATSSYSTLYILLMTLGMVLDVSEELYDRHQGAYVFKKITMEHKGWIEEMNELLVFDQSARSGGTNQVAFIGGGAVSSGSNNWKHDGVLGACLLFWGTFLSELRPEDFPTFSLASRGHHHRVLNKGFELRGLVFFRGVVRSPQFIYDEMRAVFLSILDGFVCKLITLRAGGGVSVPGDGIDNPIEDALSPRMHLLENPTSGLYRQQSQHAFNDHRSNNPSSRNNDSGVAGFGQGTPADRLVPDEEAIGDSLEDFLALQTQMHSLEPALSKKFWVNGVYSKVLDEVQQIVDRSNDPLSLYVCFLSFLASLAGDEDSAVQLIETLDNTSEVSWQTLFHALRHFQSHLVPNKVLQQQQHGQQFDRMGNANGAQVHEKRIPISDQLVLCCWLRILNGVLKSERCAKVLSASNPSLLRQQQQYGIVAEDSTLDICINLTHFQLEPALKAQLVCAVANLAPYYNNKMDRASKDDTVWAKLSPVGYQIGNALQQQKTMISRARFDLDNTESVNHTYPFTISFLDLIWTLVKNVDCESFRYLGNQSVPGILPYLEYVLYEVFLKLDQRKYRDSGEKWKVATSCLRIFVEIIDRYTRESGCALSDFGGSLGGNVEHQSYSSGFWVMTKVLEGSFLFKMLADLIQEAGGESGVRRKREYLDGDDSELKYGAMNADQQQIPMQQSTQQNFSQMQQQQLLLHQQQQQNLHIQQQGEKQWFIVASRRSNVDVRNSSIVQGEPLPPSFGHGMIRTRNRAVAPNHPCYDGGRFASWIARPLVCGWTKTVPSPDSQKFAHVPSQSEVAGGGNSDLYYKKQNSYNKEEDEKRYYWDDGDLGGVWREQCVKLIIRLLYGVSSREGWFFDGIHASEVSLDNRVERLHRLFGHRKELLHSVAEFFSLSTFVRNPVKVD
mmetsp:Transcript_8660/g.16037  ORF Transcript_8660/g.16037 Transcript_8660/m.16037 type:complete len:1194 (+) Transcript_8660:102-3683(+)